MSTKCTIDHAEKWHLYEDAVDETVWLETRGVDFIAGLGLVRIRLPEEAVDAIRKARASNFPHLRGAKSNANLRAGCPQPECTDWRRCEWVEAEQHRRRLLTGSIGLEGPWSEWMDGKPERSLMQFEYEYRRREHGTKEEPTP